MTGRRYDNYVQGPRSWGKEGQTNLHMATGWLTTDGAVNLHRERIIKGFEKQMEALIDGRRADWQSAAQEAVELLYNDLVKYPPPPPGSRYVRTGTQRRGWGWEVLL